MKTRSSKRRAVKSSNRAARPSVKEIHSFLLCSLCKGYLIDATVIVECMHSFCKDCLLKHFKTENTCPVCNLVLDPFSPPSGLRRDKARQALVYKLVPDLYKKERERRREFYSRVRHQHGGSSCRDCVCYPDTGGNRIFSLQDNFSVNLHVSCTRSSATNERNIAVPISSCDPVVERSSRNEIDAPSVFVLYFRMKAAVTIRVLKKLMRIKYGLSDACKMDVFYNEILPDELTLLDVAYMYPWKMTEPMKLFISVDQFIAQRQEFDSPETAKQKKGVKRTNTAVSGIPVKAKKATGMQHDYTDTAVSGIAENVNDAVGMQHDYTDTAVSGIAENVNDAVGMQHDYTDTAVSGIAENVKNAVEMQHYTDRGVSGIAENVKVAMEVLHEEPVEDELEAMPVESDDSDSVMLKLEPTEVSYEAIDFVSTKHDDSELLYHQTSQEMSHYQPSQGANDYSVIFGLHLSQGRSDNGEISHFQTLNVKDDDSELSCHMTSKEARYDSRMSYLQPPQEASENGQMVCYYQRSQEASENQMSHHQHFQETNEMCYHQTSQEMGDDSEMNTYSQTSQAVNTYSQMPCHHASQAMNDVSKMSYHKFSQAMKDESEMSCRTSQAMNDHSEMSHWTSEPVYDDRKMFHCTLKVINGDSEAFRHYTSHVSSTDNKMFYHQTLQEIHDNSALSCQETGETLAVPMSLEAETAGSSITSFTSTEEVDKQLLSSNNTSSKTAEDKQNRSDPQWSSNANSDLIGADENTTTWKGTDVYPELNSGISEAERTPTVSKKQYIANSALNTHYVENVESNLTSINVVANLPVDSRKTCSSTSEKVTASKSEFGAFDKADSNGISVQQVSESDASFSEGSQTVKRRVEGLSNVLTHKQVEAGLHHRGFAANRNGMPQVILKPPFETLRPKRRNTQWKKHPDDKHFVSTQSKGSLDFSIPPSVTESITLSSRSVHRETRARLTQSAAAESVGSIVQSGAPLRSAC